MCMNEIDIYKRMGEIAETPHFSMLFGEDSERTRKIADHREWLKSMMVNSLKGGYANEDEYQKLLQIYGVNPQAGAQPIMLGIDPALARDLL